MTADQRAHYLELAVFGEDVAIPGPVLARYWKATGGWSQFQTRRYCRRLADLALISTYRHDPEQIMLHDVIRAYLREQTHHRRGELDRALIDAHRSLVADDGETSAWWQLPPGQTYLWAWLPTHLQGGGLEQELRACLHHPAWLVGKLEHVGPAGLEADLALSDEPLSRSLGIAVRQNAHVLGPLEPPGSLAATLATRLAGGGPTRAIAEELIAGLTAPHLRAITTLPDLPHPALSRVMTGHINRVRTLVVAPDGSWLASASAGNDGEVRIWDPATGTTGHILTGHTREVLALAVAPDGSWLASASGHRFTSDGGEVRIWDPATGTTHHTVTGHTSPVSALAVAPDSSWLASASWDGQVLLWDPATGTTRRTLTAHTLVDLTGDSLGVGALAVAPDGSWLASAGDNGKVRIWDLATGTARRTLTGHTSWVRRIWSRATGAARHTLSGHTSEVGALAVAPDGSWLASASADDDGEVRIWDPATGAPRHTFTGHTHAVEALAVAPDGSWLASAGNDGEVRIWDPATGAPLTSLRVAGGLYHLLLMSTTIATAGEHGPYFLKLCHGDRSAAMSRARHGA